MRGQGGQAGPEGKAKGREGEGRSGQKGARQKEGSLRWGLSGPRPTQALVVWTGPSLHTDMGIWVCGGAGTLTLPVLSSA